MADTLPTEFALRVRAALAHKKLNQTTAAKLLKLRRPEEKVSPQTIQYLANKAAKSTFTVDLAAICGVDAEWLANGTGEMLSSDSGRSTKVLFYKNLPANPQHAREEGESTSGPMLSIPQLDVRASMGPGIGSPDHVDVVRMVQVNLPELRRVLPSFTTPKNLAILTGYGDSMQPTFQDGDPLVIDTGVKDVTVDGVYVLERDGPAGWELFVKRLQRQLDGSFLMISDNPKYRPQHVSEADRNRFKVAGRALGVWNFTRL